MIIFTIFFLTHNHRVVIIVVGGVVAFSGYFASEISARGITPFIFFFNCFAPYGEWPIDYGSSMMSSHFFVNAKNGMAFV